MTTIPNKINVTKLFAMLLILSSTLSNDWTTALKLGDRDQSSQRDMDFHTTLISLDIVVAE